MFVKKFEAPSLEQALKLVKTEMGPEALVLSTQEKRSGKLFSRRLVEVTAAAEKKNIPSQSARNESYEQKNKVTSQSHSDADAEIERYKAAVQKEQSQRKNKPEKYIDMDAGEEGTPLSRFRSPVSLKNQDISKYEASFKALGICPERAGELSKKMIHEYSKSDLTDSLFLKKAKTKLLSMGIRTLTAGEFFKKRSWVPVGIAGAGKTTLLVKLAMMAKEQEKSVSLISMDNRKMSGRSELANYARLIKAPFFSEISQAPLEKLKLIDSPAMGLNQENQIQLEKLCVEKSTFIVLDASARLSELMRQIEKALIFHPEAIAFSKVDHVEDLGVIYDVLKSTQLPLLGLSVSSSFKIPFKFVSAQELAQILIKE